MSATGGPGAAGDGGAAPPASVAIVGLGLIGGSLARALRSRVPGCRIAGITGNPRTAAQAVDEGVCDSAGADHGVLADVDIAVLCTPVDVMPRWLRRCAPHPGLLVTDAGSTKAWVVAEGSAALGERFLGGHPMAGRELSGWDAADADLFDGAIWAVTPHDAAQLARFAPWLAAIEAVGGIPLAVEAAAHDRATALISHAPFTLSAALVRAATSDTGWPLAATLAAGGFRDAARLAGGDPAMEAAIVATNTAPLLDTLDAVERELQDLRARVGDAERLREWFAGARSARTGWLDGRAAAGRPVR